MAIIYIRITYDESTVISQIPMNIRVPLPSAQAWDAPGPAAASRCACGRMGCRSPGCRRRRYLESDDVELQSWNYWRKFRSQTSDKMHRWKSRGGKSQRREDERRSEKRKSEKKEGAGAQKGRKVAIHRVFQMICGSEGQKVGSWHISKSKVLKTDKFGALLDLEVLKKCTPSWQRSTFRSQKCWKLTSSEHFWNLRCLKDFKSARRPWD